MENLQKRGRPKLEEISSLIKEGVQSKSPIRCRFCKRAFPREKSLQAHQRIHTGERPYRCTHPGCHKSFVQSGQLRTHQRLHTGKSITLSLFLYSQCPFANSTTNLTYPGLDRINFPLAPLSSSSTITTNLKAKNLSDATNARIGSRMQIDVVLIIQVQV